MSDRVIQTEKKSWWKGDLFFALAILILSFAIAWCMARYDRVSRAKKVYFEAEKRLKELEPLRAN